MQITIFSDLELCAESLDFRYTYGGVPLGRPNFVWNHNLVNEALGEARKKHPNIPVTLLPVKRTDPNVLPSGRWIIHLSGPPPRETHDVGRLVVIWFTDYDASRTLRAQLEEVLKGFNWDGLARGFGLFD